MNIHTGMKANKRLLVMNLIERMEGKQDLHWSEYSGGIIFLKICVVINRGGGGEHRLNFPGKKYK